MSCAQLEVPYSLCQYLVAVSPPWPNGTRASPPHPACPALLLTSCTIHSCYADTSLLFTSSPCWLCILPLRLSSIFLIQTSGRLIQSVLVLNYESDSRQSILSISDMLDASSSTTACQYADFIINVKFLARETSLKDFSQQLQDVTENVQWNLPHAAFSQQMIRLHCIKVIASIHCS